MPRDSNAGGGHDLRARAIVRHLRRRGKTHRQRLADEFGTNRRTLRNTIELLLDGGILDSSHDGHVWLSPDLGFLIGVDVTHTRATAALSRLDFTPVTDEHPSAEIPIGDPNASVLRIAELIADVTHRHLGSDVSERLVGVGITLPGPIAREPASSRSLKQAAQWDRRVQAGPILPGWDNVNVAAELATKLKDQFDVLPPRHTARRFVWVENDASAGALGVHTELTRTLRVGERPEDLIYVRMTTGIGAGIINKGHLVTGAHGFAGELGHISVDPSGALCPGCGSRGCLETIASNRAVLRQLRAVFGAGSDASDLTAGKDADAHMERELQRLLTQAHPAVDRALWDAGWHVGVALANVSSVLNPDWLVLGGLMPEHISPYEDGGRPFVDAVRDALRRTALPQPHQRLEVRTWDDIGSHHQQLTPELLGALALVVDHLGDGYLLRPIHRWIASPQSRKEPPRFSVRCEDDPPAMPDR